MSVGRGVWVDFEHLRLTVEPRGEAWEVFVYDRIAHLVLYRAIRMTVHGAKVAGLQYALLQIGDPEFRYDAEQVTERLRWKPIGPSIVQ